MLQSIIDRAVLHLGVTPEIAQKLIHFIDLQKIKGLTEPYACSNFGDYLGFLQLMDTDEMKLFFIERWGDHVVWTTVPKDYMHFLNGETPMFTPSRLEPQYQDKPFYKEGIEQTPLGQNHNTFDCGSVRKVKRPDDPYSNFIIHQFLPDFFYMEVPNDWVATLLQEGLPEATVENPYSLSMSVEEARSELQKKLYNDTHQVVTKTQLLGYTLIGISTDKLELNNDVFYTNNLLMRRTSRVAGHYYLGAIPADAISIANENIT